MKKKRELKIVVTGAAGMLGTAMIDFLSKYAEVVATDLSTGYAPETVRWYNLDLFDHSSTASWLTLEKPNVVIHCAAMVNVDGCEKKPGLARELHVETTKTIAQAVSGWNGKLIYISTDSVFNGLKTGPYSESDPVDPPNQYALTKHGGEGPVLATPKGVVLRTNIFGWSRAEKTSFAEWVIKGLVSGDRLTMFTDVLYTPVHVTHLAEIVRRVISADLKGLFHATGGSVLSKYEFAVMVANEFGLSTSSLVPTSVDTIGLEAKRPKNMSLDNNKICKALNWNVPLVQDGVALLKQQYDNGWLAAIKGRAMRPGYRFWEEQK